MENPELIHPNFTKFAFFSPFLNAYYNPHLDLIFLKVPSLKSKLHQESHIEFQLHQELPHKILNMTIIKNIFRMKISFLHFYLFNIINEIETEDNLNKYFALKKELKELFYSFEYCDELFSYIYFSSLKSNFNLNKLQANLKIKYGSDFLYLSYRIKNVIGNNYLDLLTIFYLLYNTPIFPEYSKKGGLIFNTLEKKNIKFEIFNKLNFINNINFIIKELESVKKTKKDCKYITKLLIDLDEDYMIPFLAHKKWIENNYFLDIYNNFPEYFIFKTIYRKISEKNIPFYFDFEENKIYYNSFWGKLSYVSAYIFDYPIRLLKVFIDKQLFYNILFYDAIIQLDEYFYCPAKSTICNKLKCKYFRDFQKRVDILNKYGLNIHWSPCECESN